MVDEVRDQQGAPVYTAISQAVTPLEPQHLLDLYRTAVKEVHDYHALHHQRVLHFSGLVATIVAGLFLALLQASRWEHFAFVGVGAAILIQVCKVGKVGIAGAYRLLLESITTRAKLEQALGLTEPSWTSTSINREQWYWAEEALVPSRHLEDRRAFKDSSISWENHFLAESDQRWPIRFLWSVEGLAALLLVVAAICTLKELLDG